MNIKYVLSALVMMCIILAPLGCTSNGGESEGPEPINIIKPVPDMAFPGFNPRSTVVYAGLQQNTYSKSGWDSWPNISLDGDYMAFTSSSQTGNPDIYIKTVNGTTMSQKTTSTANDIQPATSPNGKYIAFASDRNGNYDIYVTSAWSNGPLWQVTSSKAEEASPSWSYDGTKLAYSAKNFSGEWELWTLDLSTQARTNLGPGMCPKWHPSSNVITFQRPYNKEGLSCSIYTIDADGHNLKLIVRGERWAAIQPAWSPDGKRLAFAVASKSNWRKWWEKTEPLVKADDIYVVSIDGSKELRITENSGSNWSPTWGIKNGIERLYFTSDRDNHMNIWSVRMVKFTTAPEMP